MIWNAIKTSLSGDKLLENNAMYVNAQVECKAMSVLKNASGDMTHVPENLAELVFLSRAYLCGPNNKELTTQ